MSASSPITSGSSGMSPASSRSVRETWALAASAE
jgi:hypothetical protein